jgi:hypothetical protein
MRWVQACALLLSLLPSIGAAAPYYFAAQIFDETGGWVTRRESPQAACDAYAVLWGWNVAPYSAVLQDHLPGRWKCQRLRNGAVEPTWYTWIVGRCQKDPAPILTGSDWSHPAYDESTSPSCWCSSPKIFDRGFEWCTASPSCLWYPDNKASGCGKTVDDLTRSERPPSDPTSIFHANQTCIARESCNARCRMENCKWLNEVIPNFVNPYLLATERWPSIERDCRSRPRSWLNDRLCAESMARNHIFRDLLPAVIRYGCGSEQDWKSVFQSITNCTGQTFGNSLEKTLASAPVFLYRQTVRAQCVAARVSAGLDPSINNDLRGRSCSP